MAQSVRQVTPVLRVLLVQLVPPVRKVYKASRVQLAQRVTRVLLVQLAPPVRKVYKA
jgi:hypothetical protein